MVHRCAEEVETEYYPEYMEIRAKVPADAVGELLKAAQQQKSERRS